MSSVKSEQIRICPMGLDDVDIALQLEVHSPDHHWHWEKDDYVEWVKDSCNGVYLAFFEDQPVGLITYSNKVRENYVFVANVIVHTTLKDKGLHKILLQKLESHGLPEIHFFVRESDLDMHLTLRSIGYRVWCIYEKYFIDQETLGTYEENAYGFKKNVDNKTTQGLYVLNRHGDCLKKLEKADKQLSKTIQKRKS